MKKLLLTLSMICFQITFSQVNIDQILEIGIKNAQTFSKDYFAPAGESLINATSNGWYSTAAAKDLFRFEIGIIGNMTFVRKEKHSFNLNSNDYTNVTFKEGSFIQTVANVYGENSKDVVIVFNDGSSGNLEITLPDGIGKSGVNFMPTGFVQASVGIFRATEFKIRFLPKIKTVNDTSTQLVGFGIQHELTKWITGWDKLPIKFSGIFGFTNLKASYDFSKDKALDGTGRKIDGTGQKIIFNTNSWLLSTIVSTKLPVINFYAGLGYYKGSSTTDLKGTYLIDKEGSITKTILDDPISIDHKSSGLKATFGSRLSLGFFRINLDYTLQNYNNLSLGLNFGW